ncbi:MAG: AtpZ/AtpI family protein [Candidatus Dormibacteraeota bacterium]|nr:AtpZ/AtpI family protein [Candidatus Dormibacteraeota bacterium]
MEQMPDSSGRDGSKPSSRTPSGSELMGLGIAIALTLVLPLGAGVGIDALAHSSPVGAVIGLVVGIVAACAFAVNRFRQYLT